MFSDSRKAQHNSFAHHRADLLFTKPSTGAAPKDAPGPSDTDSDASDLARAFRLRVGAGILGFVPAAAGR